MSSRIACRLAFPFPRTVPVTEVRFESRSGQRVSDRPIAIIFGAMALTFNG